MFSGEGVMEITFIAEIKNVLKLVDKKDVFIALCL